MGAGEVNISIKIEKKILKRARERKVVNSIRRRRHCRIVERSLVSGAPPAIAIPLPTCLNRLTLPYQRIKPLKNSPRLKRQE